MKTETPLQAMTLPIFPLNGAVLFPGGDLPLNIFEPRYLAMTKAAMAGDQLIGMVQPCPQNSTFASCVKPFYTIGCVGRISSFEEIPDGRYLINLHGVARFKVLQQRLCSEGYRQADVSFDGFSHDFHEPEPLPAHLARSQLLAKMRDYLGREGLTVDWEMAETIPDHRLYTLLAMICPFTPAEKQALLEASTFEDRCQMMKCLMDIACAEWDGNCSQERPC